LESKAENNYPLANQRVLKSMQATVTNGEFELLLDEPLPTHTLMITVFARGINNSREPIDAIGALRLTPSSANDAVKATPVIPSPKALSPGR